MKLKASNNMKFVLFKLEGDKSLFADLTHMTPGDASMDEIEHEAKQVLSDFGMLYSSINWYVTSRGLTLIFKIHTVHAQSILAKLML